MSWVRDRQAWWKEERRAMRSSMFLAASALTFLVLVGTFAMHLLEQWSWTACFYFSVTTLATVGYGDLHPTSDVSRLFVAFYVIAGVTTALSAMAIVGRNYLMFIEHRFKRARMNEMRVARSKAMHHDRSGQDRSTTGEPL